MHVCTSTSYASNRMRDHRSTKNHAVETITQHVPSAPAVSSCCRWRKPRPSLSVTARGPRTHAPRRRSFPRLHSLSDYSLASNEEQRVIPVPGAAPSRQTLLPRPAGLLPSRPVVPQSASQPGIKTPNSTRRRHGVRTREERKFVSLIHPFHATSRQAVA